MNRNPARLGEILLSRKEITPKQLIEALSEQELSGGKLGEILVRKGYASAQNIMKWLSYQTGIDTIDLDNYPINMDAARKISEKLARRIDSIPINIINNNLLVAMADPLNIFDAEDIELESGMKTETVFALKSQIIDAIDKYMGRRNTELAAREVAGGNTEDELNGSDIDDTLDDEYVNNSPVVKLINSLIRQAVKADASDIHIEPFENRIRIRFRTDGELHEVLNISSYSHSAIVTRIKVMAEMNIAEKRLPQDGRIEMILDSDAIDMRISVLPTVYGEKIVIRILNRGNFLKSKHELGFTDGNLKIFDSIMEAPYGIVLVTGPTGSGKSTTMYSYLNELNKVNKNIVTAEIAIRAAITGHLVLSTIHTNNASSTVIRLRDMGIKPFLIAASLKGILAQRLVKKICINCKTKYMADEIEKDLLKINNDTILYKGTGCPKCYYTGYKGRIAVHEAMKIDRNLSDIICMGGSVDELAEAAAGNGMSTLKDNCRQLVLDGVTTTEEYSQIISE